MTQAKFFYKNGAVCGFKVEGHSTDCAEDDEGRAVCSAVSSAVYMAANTVTEVIGDKARIETGDGEMLFMTDGASEKTTAVLEGLKLHITELSKQYGKRLSVITEV